MFLDELVLKSYGLKQLLPTFMFLFEVYFHSFLPATHEPTGQESWSNPQLCFLSDCSLSSVF